MSSTENSRPPLLERLTGKVRSPATGGQRRSTLRSRLLAPLTSIVYRWYENQLMAEVSPRPVPRHVAMILDGNRRFALQSGLPDVTDGHRYGADKVSEVVRWCDELSIPVVTLWALSTDNLERDSDELGKIFDVVRDRLDILSEDLANGSSKRLVRAVGRLELLPDDLRRQIEEAERKTASLGPFRLNVAVAYGGRDEILDAVRRMLLARGSSGESAIDIAGGLSKDDLQPYLYAPDEPEPELIIRTSGEVRLGGFLLWQSVYSELYFCEAPWPAFRKIDFLRAIRSFQERQRRYGR